MGKVPGEGGRVTGSAADAAPAESSVAITLTGAAALGADFPPDVPDTAANRRLFEEIKAQIDAMPEGTVVGIPYDYTD